MQTAPIRDAGRIARPIPILGILQAPHEKLTTPSTPVDNFDAPGLAGFVESLIATRRHHEAVGLAAPQVGVLKRIVALNAGQTIGWRVIVNPVIVEHGKNQSWGEEGCLSIGKGKPLFRVKRWDTITVQWDDLSGCPRIETARGYAARVLQHELDHLDGKLVA